MAEGIARRFFKEKKYRSGVYPEPLAKGLAQDDNRNTQDDRKQARDNNRNDREIAIFSAGIIPGKMHEVTQEVMKEINIDISNQYSKSYLEIPLHQMDVIITMSDLAQSTIKGISGLSGKVIHWDIEDPYQSAADKKQLYENYRRARNEIKKKISILRSSSLHYDETQDDKR